MVGQRVLIEKNEWIQYSIKGGAEFIDVCMPVFSLEAVHRDD